VNIGEKPTANIMTSGVFSIERSYKAEITILTTSIQHIVLVVLLRAIRQEKQKAIQTRKGNVTLSLFADDMKILKIPQNTIRTRKQIQ
jgi:hypothetical protein